MARESVYEKIQRSFKQEGVEFTEEEQKHATGFILFSN